MVHNRAPSSTVTASSRILSTGTGSRTCAVPSTGFGVPDLCRAVNRRLAMGMSWKDVTRHRTQRHPCASPQARLVTCRLSTDTTRVPATTAEEEVMTATTHARAEEHEHHTHGPGCGHESVVHNDHVDYFHGGHAHREHAGHYDECTTCQCSNCEGACAGCRCTDCTCPNCNHGTCSCTNCGGESCANCTCADCDCPTCAHGG